MKIGILVGHGKSDNGGYDSGAVNKTLTPKRLIHEFSIAKEIAFAVASELKGCKCDVELINFNGDKNLKERIAYCNKNGFDVILEVHLNAFTTATARGVEAYYYPNDKLGRKVADTICKTVAKELSIPQRSNGIDDGGDKASAYFGIIRQTNCTAVLVETCFITTDSELLKVDELAEQHKLGRAVGVAIAQALGLEKAALADDYRHIVVHDFKNEAAAKIAKAKIDSLGYYNEIKEGRYNG